jgi:hypothetical protein
VQPARHAAAVGGEGDLQRVAPCAHKGPLVPRSTNLQILIEPAPPVVVGLRARPCVRWVVYV